MLPAPRVRGSELYVPLSGQLVSAVTAVTGRPQIQQRSFNDTPHDKWFVLPYTPAHVKAWNLATGSKLPGPAFAAWAYPGLRAPFTHQRLIVDFLTQNRRAFCFSGMGTGKTSGTLWAAEYLRQMGEVKRVLILSPLSTLRVVWVDELFKINPTVACSIAHGSKEKRERAWFGQNPYVVMNHDGLRLMDADKVALQFDLVIIDEIGVFRTWQSGGPPARYKQLLKLAHHPHVTRVWGLTGTPTPNGPFDAWALVKIINPSFNVPKTRFQTMVMQQITEFKWVPKAGAAEQAAELLQPSIRFSTEDVLKYLPPQVYTTREVPLSPEQTKMRNAFRTQYKAEHKGREVTAANAAIMLSKVLQTAAGAVRVNEDEKPLTVSAAPRLKALTDLVEEAEGKAIIFCSFRAPIEMIVAHFEDHGISAAAIHGDVSAGRRAEIYRDFQEEEEPRVIVAHPATTAHGITLTAANLIVWYGPIFSNELYEQGNARAHRPGQHRVVTVAHISSTPEEAAIYKVLRSRGEMQKTILDLAREIAEC